MDYLLFIAAIALSCALLLTPGYALLRACVLPRVWALCAAPAATAAIFGAVCLVWCSCNIPCNALTVAVLPTLAFAATSLFTNNRFEAPRLPRIEWRLVALFAIVGCAAGAVVFLRILPDPNSFAQAWDNQHHLNGIRAFADAQRFDTLHQSAYLTAADIAINPMPDYGYYPSTWLAMCAMVVQVFGCSAGMAENAVNFALAAILFPLGALAFFATLFNSNRRLLAVGSIAVVSFNLFPWEMFSYGPLFPNLAAFACMPCALAFIAIALGHSHAKQARIEAVGLFIVSCLGLVFLQPNAIFSTAVLVAGLFVQSIATSKGVTLGKLHIHPAVLACAFAVLCVAVWIAAYHAPFMQGVIHDSVWHYEFADSNTAIQGILNLGYVVTFYPSSAQPIGAVLVLIGVARTLKERRYLWVSFSYLLTCVILYASLLGDVQAKEFFAGFWYSDPFRCGVMATIAAMPLLALGAGWILDAVSTLAEKAHTQKAAKPCSVALLTAFALLTFAPNFLDAQDIYGKLNQSASRVLSHWYGPEDGPYTPDEVAFCRQVARTVGTEALIVNQPSDGSFYAYGDCGLRVLYRSFNGYEVVDETESSKLIRYQLNHIETAPEVASTCRQMNAQYVLVLHRNNMPESFINGQYWEAAWLGIDSITDETPGFEVVLAQDDMRLYRITATEEEASANQAAAVQSAEAQSYGSEAA